MKLTNLLNMLLCFFQDGSINFIEFITALSITSRGSLDEKLECKYLCVLLESNYVYIQARKSMGSVFI